jgi:hypothetical protein
LLDADPWHHPEEFWLICHVRLAAILRQIDFLLAEQQSRVPQSKRRKRFPQRPPHTELAGAPRQWKQIVLAELEWHEAVALVAEPGDFSTTFLLAYHTRAFRLLQHVDFLLNEQRRRHAQKVKAFYKKRRGWVMGSPRELKEARRAAAIMRKRGKRERGA